AQLSISIARSSAATAVAARTNHPAPFPSVGVTTPAIKNAPAPSCARGKAAALHTDMNGSRAADDRTTRIGSRDRRGIEGNWSALVSRSVMIAFGVAKDVTRRSHDRRVARPQ